MQSGDAIPPQQRGISAILARYPMKTWQNGCHNPPLCETISKSPGYCAICRGYLALGNAKRLNLVRLRKKAASCGLPFLPRLALSMLARKNMLSLLFGTRELYVHSAPSPLISHCFCSVHRSNCQATLQVLRGLDNGGFQTVGFEPF